MNRPIWVRLRSVLDRKREATTVTLNRESAEEMLAEIARLRAALEYIAKGGLAYPEKHARAALAS